MSDQSGVVRIVSAAEWRERAERAEAELRQIQDDASRCKCAGHAYPCPLWKGYDQVPWKT